MAKQSDKICDICGERSGEVHVVQYIDGKMKKLFACRKCAQTVGIVDQLSEGGVELETAFPLNHACPKCGWKLQDLINTGLLGCANCYIEFGSEIMPILSHFHGEISFYEPEKADPMQKLSLLHWQLRKAVDEERFEEAAQLRDMIQNIEKKVLE